MRAFLLLPFLALPATAADFIAPAPVTEATVYAGGALMTRTASLSLPAGTHRILVPQPANYPQIRMTGDLRILGTSILGNQLSDATRAYLPAQTTAQTALDAAEGAVTDRKAALAAARNAIPAIEAQLAFLRTATAAGLETLDPAALAETAVLLGGQIATLEAQLFDAQQSLVPLRDAVTEAEKIFAQAKSDLDRLTPPASPVSMLAIDVSVASDTDATLHIDGYTQAYWAPTYELFLSTGDAPSLSVQRKVSVAQYSGLPWENVALHLSTANLEIDVAPSGLYPDRVHLLEPKRKVVTFSSESADMNLGRMSAPAMEPMVVEDSRMASFEMPGGLSVRYDYPTPITLLSGNDALILNLDTLDVPVETFVRAVPRRDETAYLMAKVKNDLPEPLLAGTALLYRDTVFIGEATLPLIVAGANKDLPFGALDRVLLSFNALKNDTGDRGLISTSNTRLQSMEFTVENLMPTEQTVETLFALPFSEQEDLEVSVRTRPQPTERDWDKNRSVGRWEFDLAPGEKQTVTVDVEMTWPDGQIVDWQP